MIIDADAREDDINQYLSESREHMAECNLRMRVTPFFDFTMKTGRMLATSVVRGRP
jgi:hypothetical protein